MKVSFREISMIAALLPVLIFNFACEKKTSVPKLVVYENSNYPSGNFWRFGSGSIVKSFSSGQQQIYNTARCVDQVEGEICWIAEGSSDDSPEAFLRLTKKGNWEKLFRPSPLVRRYKLGHLDCLTFATAGQYDNDDLEFRNTFQFCDTVGIYSFAQQQVQPSDNFDRTWIYQLKGEKGLLSDCSISTKIELSTDSGTTATTAAAESNFAEPEPWIVCPTAKLKR